MAFSRHFGPLETTVKANPAGGSYFARQSNLDIRTGAVIPAEDRRMVYQKGNYLWHTDSSFKPIPALCSLLSGRIVPPEGGDTDFASMRAAYAELPETMKSRIEGLVAEHSLVYSRRSRIKPERSSRSSESRATDAIICRRIYEEKRGQSFRRGTSPFVHAGPKAL